MYLVPKWSFYVKAFKT